MSANPFVSIVIPCRNEESHIDRCLASVAAFDYPKDRLEVLVVDGMSDDHTRDVVAQRAAHDEAITLLENPARIAPSAMNIGIRRAQGEIIVRLDAHAVYPPEYVSKLVKWLEASGADNVGGVWLTQPANDSSKAAAIATALAHPFGVGNAYFRIGSDEPRWVDTVPFGCYRRDVFNRIGLFDEDLVRNQDDEFNARLIRRGGRILLVPDIVSEYFARETLTKLWRMYFQYGYFKPLVAKKLGAVMTVRQLVPALFVIVLALAAAMSVVPVMRLPFIAVLTAYLVPTLWFSARAGFTGASHRLSRTFWLTLAFPTLHFGYGSGFLKGIVDFVLRDRRGAAELRAMAPSR